MDTTQRQRRRAERLDDPRFERYRNPRSRRRLAAAVIGLLAVQVVVIAMAGWIDDGMAAAVWLGVILVLVVGFVLVMGVLKASTRGVEELSPGVMDERMTALRGEVYARSYRVLGAVVMAGALAGFLAVVLDLTPSREVGIAVVVLLWQLAIVVPTLCAAFMRRL